jgi:preprotein translocase subunit SecG
MELISTLLTLLFVLSALLLIVVVLIQEGKGGGLGDAFGGAGQQTFGVGAKGITRFTSYVAVAFVVLAIAITILQKQESGSITAGAGGSSLMNTTPAEGGEG